MPSVGSGRMCAVLRRPALLGSLVLLLCLLAPAPGWAGSWSAPDPVGDARTVTFDPEPPPCGTYVEGRSRVGDVRRVGVRHARDTVTVRVDVVGLAQVRRPSTVIPLRTERRDYEVDVTVRPGRPVRAFLSTATRYTVADGPDECDYDAWFGTSSGIPCRIGTRLDLAAGRLTVSVPRACLRSPRWVRAGASLQAEIDGGAAVLDRWERPDRADGDDLTPAYGARVRWSPR